MGGMRERDRETERGTGAGSTVYEYLTQAEGHENESRDNECSRQLDKKKREMPMSLRHPAVRHPGAMPGIRVA